MISVTVPEGCPSGAKLRCEVPGGQNLTVVVPPQAVPGTVLTLRQDPTSGSWNYTLPDQPEEAPKPAPFSGRGSIANVPLARMNRGQQHPQDAAAAAAEPQPPPQPQPPAPTQEEGQRIAELEQLVADLQAQPPSQLEAVDYGPGDRGKGRGRLYDNVLETIGNTPCVRINEKMCPPGRTIYAKLEYFNPLSSVKDRLAVAVIEDAEAKGLLVPYQDPPMTVVEATSGNTGIAIAMVCAQRGYDCVIIMAETFSVERRKLMRMLGARVVLTPKAGKGTGMVQKARELAEAHGWFLGRQFENEANPLFHEATTGREILQDFAGQRLDYFVLGYGTGGTFAGAGAALRAERPDVKICISEPEAAPMLQSGVQSDRNDDGSASSSHPAFKAHPIQGWAPDFIPQILENGVATVNYDEYVAVPGPAAIDVAQQLARTQGILTGISGGASVFAAIEMAKAAPEGSVLLAMIADTGERYLSTPLFESIGADMDEAEVQISRSTPSMQMAVA